jgi:hypothetical protein
MTGEHAGLRSRLEQLSTLELTSILERRDADEWRPEVFAIVSSILTSRGVFLGNTAKLDAMVAETRAVDAGFTPEEGSDPIASGLEVGDAEDASKILRSVGIDVYLSANIHGFSCYVPSTHAARATGLLREAGIVREEDDTGLPVGVIGGPCPGCGALIQPGCEECPECGLAT